MNSRPVARLAPKTRSPATDAAPITNVVGIPTPASLRGMHGQIVEHLGTVIAEGGIEVGQQIVPEALADQFSVSRPVVREALKVLEAKGLIAARPRTGTRVRPAAEWSLLDPDVIRWRSTGPDSSRQLAELLGIRSAIEPFAARDASRRATPTDIQGMVDALEAMASSVVEQDWESFTEADVLFHRALLRASGSLTVMQLAEPIEAALRVRRRQRLVPAYLSDEAVAMHQAILDAIVSHDGPGAELMSRRIVDQAGAEVMAALVTDSPNDEITARTATT